MIGHPRSFAVFAGVVALAFAPAARAQEAPRQTLKQVEQEIQADKTRQRHLDRQSKDLQKDIDALRARLVELTAEAQMQEQRLDDLEIDLAALEREEHDKVAALDARRQETAELLGALQRLSRLPPEAVLARPGGPVDTLRSALLLRSMVPALRERADAVSEALNALADTREKLVSQRDRAAAARAALDAQRREIAPLVTRREELYRQTDEERITVAQNTARLTGQAADLRQLMERIEQERRAAVAAAARREGERLEAERRTAERQLAEQKAAELRERRDAERQEAERKAAEKAVSEKTVSEKTAREKTATALPPAAIEPGSRLPVAGKVNTRFGEQDRYGATSRGITIATRPGAAVVAPYSGSIMFAGPFRGYGQILIVEHANGYHSLIAGFGRIDVAVGRRVATGEPIGSMPAPSDGTPDLYYELRRNGQPINPQRGLGSAEAKGQG